MRRLVPLALAAVALAGCLARRPVPQTTEGDWARARDGSSRRQFLYDGWDHRATATATHLSLAVREARARRLAVWYGWTPQELEKRLAEERKEADEGEEFLLAFYTVAPKNNDLDAPASVWRVAVKDGDVVVLARRVTAIDRNATVLGLFPYVGGFDVVYRVLLPKPPGGPLAGRPFTLELSSALGRIHLEYGNGAPPGPSQPEEAR